MTQLLVVAAALGGAAVTAVVSAWIHTRRNRDVAASLVSRALALGVPPDAYPGASTEVPAALDAVDAGVQLVEGRRRDTDVLCRRLAEALDAIPVGVVVATETGEVVFRNEPAAEFHGARHGEALVEAAVGDLLAGAVGGRAGDQTLELFGPPRRTVVVTATPLSDGRRLVGAMVLIDDVSDRRRLEEVRRDFVTNISHELKTPVGALSLLAESLATETTDEVGQRLAARMVVEAQRVADTIDDLLVLSRIESSDLAPVEHVAVTEVVAEAVERIEPALGGGGITMMVADVDDNLWVVGDRRQLVSALFNLLDNAVKYSDAGATVTVQADNRGDAVHLSVTDTGIGIPARDVERVFERFYRVDAARSRQTGGTGLGLAIVRHVAANHRGEVRVDSRLGEGSTFTLLLPVSQGDANGLEGFDGIRSQGSPPGAPGAEKRR